METDPKKKNPLIPTEEEEPLSESMRKEKEKSVIPVHGRHMLLRIILFLRQRYYRAPLKTHQQPRRIMQYKPRDT
jgi:hypothetical protein